MAVVAIIQTQLDRLAPLPGAIAAAIENAGAAATAQAAQNDQDAATALGVAIDPIVAAIPAPPPAS